MLLICDYIRGGSPNNVFFGDMNGWDLTIRGSLSVSLTTIHIVLKKKESKKELEDKKTL